MGDEVTDIGYVASAFDFTIRSSNPFRYPEDGSGSLDITFSQCEPDDKTPKSADAFAIDFQPFR